MNISYVVGAPRISIGSDTKTPGPSSHIRGFTTALRNGGHQVDLFLASQQAYGRSLGRTEEEQVQGASARRVIGDMARLSISVANMVAAHKTARLHKPELIYERFATYQSIGWAMRRRFGCPWIVETNGLFFEEGVSDRSTIGIASLARKHEQATYKSADAVVAVSDEIKASLVDRCGVSEDRIIVLPNGVDKSIINAAKGDTQPRESGTHLGFIGQVVEWQGLDQLVRILSDLPSSWTATIVGDGPALPSLKTQAEALGLGDRVRFMGRLPHIDALRVINACDIGYAGHRAAGGRKTYHSPLKTYEYLALGLTVVATESTANDARATASNIVPFDASSDTSLLRALTDASQRSTDAASLATRARVALDEHSWDSRVAQFFEAIAERGLIRVSQ